MKRGAVDEHGGGTSLPGSAVGVGMAGIELFSIIRGGGYSSQISEILFSNFAF